MIHKNFGAMFALLSVGLMGCSAQGPEPSGSESQRVVTSDGGVCIENVLCIGGDHFDHVLCRCVPDDAGAPACIENVLCIRGDHFDHVLCRCVPDDAGAPVCISKEDGPCGGFTQDPCRCAPGLACVPNRIPDIPGTCEPKRCCPRAWDMFKCNEENGSTGLNCHNPQLACASSLTCGAGCDFQVTGRCPVCDPIPCPKGQTFDSTLCKCIPPRCTTAADCQGPLPQLCEVCADGGASCAHWSCAAGRCEVALCQ